MSRLGSQREYHIAVIGSGGVGKSCLTAQFVQGIFVESYDPTIEDSYRKPMTIDNRHVMLEIMDTAGTEQFTSMRELYMREAQGFLLVFSITSSSSLQELHELRDQIVHIKNDPKVPIVLVGNKLDLEDDRTVSQVTAYSVARAWGQIPYYETSARRSQNVTEVFVDVCRQIMRRDMLAVKRVDYPSTGVQSPPVNSRRQGSRRKDKRDDEYTNHRRALRRRDRHRCVIL